MVPTFRWETEDNNTRRAKIRPLTYTLVAGTMPLFTLWPGPKTYEIHTSLPGVAFHKKYLPLEQAKAAAEISAERWFKACFSEHEA